MSLAGKGSHMITFNAMRMSKTEVTSLLRCYSLRKGAFICNGYVYRFKQEGTCKFSLSEDGVYSLDNEGTGPACDGRIFNRAKKPNLEVKRLPMILASMSSEEKGEYKPVFIPCTPMDSAFLKSLKRLKGLAERKRKVVVSSNDNAFYYDANGTSIVKIAEWAGGHVTIEMETLPAGEVLSPLDMMPLMSRELIIPEALGFNRVVEWQNYSVPEVKSVMKRNRLFLNPSAKGEEIEYDDLDEVITGKVRIMFGLSASEYFDKCEIRNMKEKYLKRIFAINSIPRNDSRGVHVQAYLEEENIHLSDVDSQDGLILSDFVTINEMLNDPLISLKRVGTRFQAQGLVQIDGKLVLIKGDVQVVEHLVDDYGKEIKGFLVLGHHFACKENTYRFGKPVISIKSYNSDKRASISIESMAGFMTGAGTMIEAQLRKLLKIADERDVDELLEEFAKDSIDLLNKLEMANCPKALVDLLSIARSESGALLEVNDSCAIKMSIDGTKTSYIKCLQHQSQRLDFTETQLAEFDEANKRIETIIVDGFERVVIPVLIHRSGKIAYVHPKYINAVCLNMIGGADFDDSVQLMESSLRKLADGSNLGIMGRYPLTLDGAVCCKFINLSTEEFIPYAIEPRYLGVPDLMKCSKADEVSFSDQKRTTKLNNAFNQKLLLPKKSEIDYFSAMASPFIMEIPMGQWYLGRQAALKILLDLKGDPIIEPHLNLLMRVAGIEPSDYLDLEKTGDLKLAAGLTNNLLGIKISISDAVDDYKELMKLFTEEEIPCPISMSILRPLSRYSKFSLTYDDNVLGAYNTCIDLVEQFKGLFESKKGDYAAECFALFRDEDGNAYANTIGNCNRLYAGNRSFKDYVADLRAEWVPLKKSQVFCKRKGWTMKADDYNALYEIEGQMKLAERYGENLSDIAGNSMRDVLLGVKPHKNKEGRYDAHFDANVCRKAIAYECLRNYIMKGSKSRIGSDELFFLTVGSVIDRCLGYETRISNSSSIRSYDGLNIYDNDNGVNQSIVAPGVCLAKIPSIKRLYKSAIPEEYMSDVDLEFAEIENGRAPTYTSVNFEGEGGVMQTEKREVPHGAFVDVSLNLEIRFARDMPKETRTELSIVRDEATSYSLFVLQDEVQELADMAMFKETIKD